MFNFTTQTLVRDDKNIVVKGITDGGIINNATSVIINGVELPKSNNTRTVIIEGEGDNNDQTIKIPENKNIRYVSVFKQKAIAGTKASITLRNLSSLDFSNSDFGRIAIQIKLSNSSVDPLFANNMVYRGKPIYAEFKVAGNTLTENEIKKIAKTLNKVSTFDSQILTAEANGTDLTITCSENYMNLDSVKIQKFVETAGSCNNCCHYDEQFKDLTEGQARGVEEFGTYKWILHNLRIPTDASQAYNGQLSTMGELPAPGEKYTQYTIKMEADRENIGGMVVGEKTTSVTTHVFYVKEGSRLEQTFKFENNNLEADITFLDLLFDLVIPIITGRADGEGFKSINDPNSILDINGADVDNTPNLSVLDDDTNLLTVEKD